MKLILNDELIKFINKKYDCNFENAEIVKYKRIIFDSYKIEVKVNCNLTLIFETLVNNDEINFFYRVKHYRNHEFKRQICSCQEKDGKKFISYFENKRQARPSETIKMKSNDVFSCIEFAVICKLEKKLNSNGF